VFLQLRILKREEDKAEKILKFKLIRTRGTPRHGYEITAFNQSTNGNAIYSVRVTHNDLDVEFNYADIEYSQTSLPIQEKLFFKKYLIIKDVGVVPPISIPKSEAVVFALFFNTLTIGELNAKNLELGNGDLPIFKITVVDFRENIYAKEVRNEDEALDF
jgi:hypothetical protein